MAQDHEPLKPNPTQTHLNPVCRFAPRVRIPLRRRRKLPTVRLGGNKKPRRVLYLAKIFRRMRLRWLKLQYRIMLKKLKEYYRNMIKDMKEASATLETFHHRVLLEASLAVPVMGVSFNSYPYLPGSDRPRTLTMWKSPRFIYFCCFLYNLFLFALILSQFESICVEVIWTCTITSFPATNYIISFHMLKVSIFCMHVRTIMLVEIINRNRNVNLTYGESYNRPWLGN